MGTGFIEPVASNNCFGPAAPHGISRVRAIGCRVWKAICGVSHRLPLLLPAQAIRTGVLVFIVR